ncbi:esterase/lipase family protein [Goodfellowiella coeruleoviolacea]|uniref:Triacylglycerol lipase n=1 Tax=Goodfellowiella coeruleoviolacea TaxID=334858 RepID=A0AAE3GI96_9PSEU|nr:alpha/beta fold hydrolase [Goodfellowiella coeruleoviolacea]MCP2168692.1 triacylglycerol lipase [Goodfellowiella coeruleoviolacea]
MRKLFTTLLVGLAAAAAVLLGPAGPAHAAGHTPVVFVHGYTGSTSNWATAMTAFLAAGYSSNELYSYEYNYNASNQASAAGLATFVNQVRSRTGASKVDIVNHSMGGMVSRWYVKQLGGHQYVSHWASLAGANHGTTFASSCVIFPSCVEMLPGSSFLNTLNSGDETPGSTRYATWYSPCDGVIIPYTSTRVDGAENNLVACQNHILFLTDLLVLSDVRRFLAS